MMPKNINYPPLSKNVKKIWIAFLVLFVSIIVFVPMIQSYFIQKKTETIDSQGSTDITTPEETTLSYYDREYEEWYKEISDSWYDAALVANEYMTKGNICGNVRFLEQIEKLKELSDEISSQPAPSDPVLKKRDEELKAQTMAPYAAMVAYDKVCR